jgi:hypothetical protein
VLAFEKLGISMSRPIYKVKFDLKKSHDELIRTGFLAEVPNFVKGSDDKWFVEYCFSNNDLFSNFNQFPTLHNNSSILQEVEFAEHQNKKNSENIKVEIKENQYVENTELQKVEKLKHGLLKIGLNVSEIGKLLDAYSGEKILEALELFEVTILNKTKIRNPKNWIFACLKNDFDNTAVVEKKKRIKEAEIIIEVEAKERAQKEIEDKLMEQENLERKQKIDEWIVNNIEEFVELRQNYISKLEEQGGIMWKQLVKKANEQDKTFAKVITEIPLYSSELRNNIWKNISVK